MTSSPLRKQGPIRRGCSISVVGVDTFGNNAGRWLWVPAFAGTTERLTHLRSRRLVGGRLAMAQEAAQQPALALARHEIDVADEFGAALASLVHDLAAVKGIKLGAMAVADDRGLWQLFGHQLHHLVL